VAPDTALPSALCNVPVRPAETIWAKTLGESVTVRAATTAIRNDLRNDRCMVLMQLVLMQLVFDLPDG
jgi:hypothetical protein